MSGRRAATVVLLLIVGLMGFLVWLAFTNRGGDGGEAAAPNGAVGREGPPPGPAAASAAAAADALLDGGPIRKTVADRAVRDELRRRILLAWANNPDEKVATAAKEGRFVPIPDDRDASREYLREVVREDFVPMARQCYEELLTRKRGASGTLLISFKLVGDEKIGGVIEDADVETEGGLADEKLLTCIRESFLSLAFRPPPNGWMTVRYPLVFAADDEHDG